MRKSDGTIGGRSAPEKSLQPTKIPDSVIRIGRSKESIRSQHPAIFPVALPSFVMQSWPGIAYEPFLGSGTTIVAGEQTGSLVRGIELAPKYVGVILERLSLLGLEPVQCK